jgi:hypothetical protein
VREVEISDLLDAADGVILLDLLEGGHWIEAAYARFVRGGHEHGRRSAGHDVAVSLALT